MLPDELKGDCSRFFASPAGQLLLQSLRARAPDNPRPGMSPHDLIRAYSMREGYQFSVDNLVEIIHESNALPPPTKEEMAEAVLLNPAD
jgi:hypothetical protein